MTTRNTNRKPAAKDEQLSLVDQMADDATPEEAPERVDYPEGAPEFKVLLAVRPRGKRAAFKRCIATITERNGALTLQQKQLSELTDEREREAALYRLSAQLEEMYEVVEDALRLVAVDEAAFDEWVVEVDDEELALTWTAYQQRAQPGEASSSTS